MVRRSDVNVGRVEIALFGKASVMVPIGLVE